MEKIRGPIHLSIFIGFGKTELRQSTYSLHKHVFLLRHLQGPRQPLSA